jgi:hypothetical protein
MGGEKDAHILLGSHRVARCSAFNAGEVVFRMVQCSHLPKCFVEDHMLCEEESS